MERANDENRSTLDNEAAKNISKDANNAYTPSSRRILSDVSPNVNVTASSSPAFLKRALAGSPLKRSFTAAMEGSEGLTYLKRRRLEDSEVLSEVAETRFRPSYEEAVEVTKVESEAVPIESTYQQPSPTEPNTPSEEASDSQDSSAGGKSFSSLINYDPSSQTSQLVFKTVSNAEMLRLRLRVAMYKVRTNQMGKSFTELMDEERSKLTLTQQAIEDAVAELRREAQEVAARKPQAARVPKLLPAPVLQPTAYSSRMIYPVELPGSPSPPSSPDKLPAIAGAATPLGKVRHQNSPPNSAQRFTKQAEQELTSSVVKGRVAEGLLGLRNAV